MTAVIASVKLSTGVTLPYLEQGLSSGIPVVLLHGTTDSWRSFEGVLPYLPAELRAFALTQRGHGDADRPETGYRPSDFSADVAAFLDAVGIDAAIVAGHSMGSFIAQRFALDYPERTLGLVLAGSFATLRDHAGIQEFWDEAIANLSDPVPEELAFEFQESTLTQAVPPAFLEMVVGESLKVPARVWKASFAGLMEADHRAELGKIAAPTLIIWGDQDTIAPGHQQDALAAGIPNARLLVYHGAGHGLHWEEPQRFAADLVVFVRSIES